MVLKKNLDKILSVITHLLLELSSKKTSVYVPYDCFSLPFPDKIIDPLAIDDKIRSLINLKRYILKHPIKATSENTDIVEMSEENVRWTPVQIN